MARIAGVDLPRDKRVEIGLTYIFGVGLPTSQKVLKEAGVNPDTRVKDLTDDEVGRIREVLDKTAQVEGDLRREIALNIKRLTEIGCYRGKDIAAACRCVVRIPKTTPAHAKVRSVLSAANARNKERGVI